MQGLINILMMMITIEAVKNNSLFYQSDKLTQLYAGPTRNEELRSTSQVQVILQKFVKLPGIWENQKGKWIQLQCSHKSLS